MADTRMHRVTEAGPVHDEREIEAVIVRGDERAAQHRRDRACGRERAMARRDEHGVHSRILYGSIRLS